VGIGVSLILIAVGAVLAFAMHPSSSGFDIDTVGYTLLAVGAIGRSRRTVVENAAVARRRTVVHEQIV
jgi:Domain of unknown function (DUF6458)